MEANPFQPPSTSLANPVAPTVSPDRRSRWALIRWLPLAYCGCLTVACLLFGVLQITHLGFLLLFDPAGRGRTGWANELVVALAFPVAFGLAALGVRTVRAWYRCRWRPALVLTLVFFVLAALADAARDHLMPIRLAPAVAPRQR